MNGIVADIRHACRTLSGNPGFTAMILLLLALGIGGNSAIFSVVNAVLIQPLDYPASRQLTQIGRQLPAGFSNAQTILQFVYFKDQNRSFSGMATYDGRGGGMNLSEGGEPERIPSIRVSSGFFDVLQSPPQLGRNFRSEDGLPGAEKVAIISDGLWKRRFGADRGVVGRSLRLSGESYTVVGVMRPGCGQNRGRSSGVERSSPA
jgi:putative ABC transport system permease protein